MMTFHMWNHPNEEMKYYLPQNLQILPFGHHLLPRSNYYPDFNPIDFFLAYFWGSYKWTQTICTLLGLASFAQCHVYKDHTTACSCSFVILIADILLHEYTIIFIHSIIDRHLNCFLFVLLQIRPL